MLSCISLFFSRNVDKQLTDVHVGQLSADVAGVVIPYLQRNEVRLVTAFDLRSFNSYNNIRSVMDMYGPVELKHELNSQAPYVADMSVLYFIYLVCKFALLRTQIYIRVN